MTENEVPLLYWHPVQGLIAPARQAGPDGGAGWVCLPSSTGRALTSLPVGAVALRPEVTAVPAPVSVTRRPISGPRLRKYLSERLAEYRDQFGTGAPVIVTDLDLTAVIETLAIAVRDHHPGRTRRGEIGCHACAEAEQPWPCPFVETVARWFAHREDFDVLWLPPGEELAATARDAVRMARQAGGLEFAPGDYAPLDVMSWLSGLRPVWGDSSLGRPPRLGDIPVYWQVDVPTGHVRLKGQSSACWAVDEAHGMQPRFTGVVMGP